MNEEALVRLLKSTSGRLRDELARFDTGTKWQRYLQVPDEAFADASSSSIARREALASALERFHKIAAAAQYRMIAELPAFRATQAVLTELISRSAQPGNETAPGTEDLPLPAPARPETERSLLRGITH